ncbi:MAG: PKD domain-containing protein, partial [Sulfurovum sp.]|nr:PKD domain-containing protein [Sulfurovum sp.]
MAGCADTVKSTTSTNTAPTAKAEVNAGNIKYGDSVTFDANASTDSDGQIVSYEWKDESGVTLSQEVQFAHTFDATGTHSITLTVTDDDGATATGNVTVTVQELQKPNAVIGTSATLVKVGDSITFDANASNDTDGQIVSYAWVDDTNITLSNQKVFVHTFSASREHNITLVVTDNDGLEGKAIVSVVAEAVLFTVSIESLSSLLEVDETTTLTATAHYNDNSSQNVNTSVEWVVGDASILTVDANGTLKALKSGTTAIQAKIGAIVSNTLNIEVRRAVTLQSIAVSPSPVNIRVGNTVQVNITGLYSDGSTQNVETASYTVVDSNIATVDDSGSVDGLVEGSTTLSIQAGVFTSSVAVVVAKEMNTTNFNFTNFGNTYIDQIPTDATVENYDEKRFCMIAGQILSVDGTPLQGVKVSIHKHPEYGTTLTDSNGTYTMPSEGGLQLTMRYSKQGYTSIDRNIQAPVQDWVRSPDVTMLMLDTKVTSIDLANTTAQMHVSTPVTDDRGERSTTLVFDAVTKATVTSADGSTRELTSLNVRATEFETPKSMPSDLPIESAYTYCSDLTVDGVRDDEEVTFDAPVIMYVDNFLGFDVGEIVPIGYYDRNAGEWKASDNGVVVKLLDTDGDGTVDALDSNGSDTPNDLDGDGNFADEVAGIQDNPSYLAGKTYWRAAITHFTPWDHNWPYGPPEDVEDPDEPDVDDDNDPKNDCQASVSSYVTTKSRVFHEDIPVAGTDITLHYSSKRVGGYDYLIDTKVDTTSAPTSTLSAVATLEVGGKMFTRALDLGTVNQLSFVWDGKDVLDSGMSGEVTAKLTVKYVYNMVYYRSSTAFSNAWARAGSSTTAIRGRTTLVRSTTKDIKLNVEKSSNGNSHLANGWTLSNLHNLGVNAVYKGDGSKIEKETSLEDGLIAYYQFDGDAQDSSGQDNHATANGTLVYKNGKVGDAAYFTGTQNIKTPIELTGIEENQYISISLWGKAENSENSTFITNYNIGDGSNSVHMAASNIGISGRFGGYYSNGFCYKYNLINLISIAEPIPDLCGNLNTIDTIYDYGNNPIDFTQWTHYTFTYDNHTERIYINGVKVVEKELESNMVGGDNKIERHPRNDNSYDRYLNIGQYNNVFGYPSSQITKSMLKGAIDDLRIYKKVLTDNAIQAIYNFGTLGKSSYVLEGLNISDNTLEYKFNLDGKHLSTSTYPNKTLLETYTYDSNGHVKTITDNFNQTTTITRDTNGYPTSITAPNGQVTTLSVDENGDLTEVRYEDNSKYEFSYFDGSLMNIMTDPNGNNIQHVWNDTGRIVEEIDGLNGSYQFLRNVSAGETFYSTIRPEGETSTSKDLRLANGDTQSLMTLPIGETLTATFAKDESKTTSLRDGVSSVVTYTTDTLTHQRILATRETTQPSGLKSTTSYSTVYDGNETHTNSKTQTITANTKTTTATTNYNNGTETITSPENRVATRVYDVDTLLTSSISTGSLTPTAYTYDSKGRVTTELTGTRETSYTYDNRGNLATTTNERGQSTSYSYDSVDNLTSIT